MSIYSKMPDTFDGSDYSNTAPAPERIYLQWSGESLSEDNTWAEHTINDEDIPYVRADILASGGKLEPIETAPTDGTDVLAWDGNSYAVLFYSKYGNGWTSGNPKTKYQPTHWVRLPEPPHKQ